MNKKYHLYLFGLVVLTALVIGIYFSKKQQNNYFDSIQFDNKLNVVFNKTSQSYYDTIIMTGLDFLGLENIDITVEPLSDGAKENFAKQGGELSAHIRESNGNYYLYIDPTLREDAIEIIAHELIHLKQYNSSELIYQNDTLTWKNKSYLPYDLPYGERPWEIDADNKGFELSKQIRQKLY